MTATAATVPTAASTIPRAAAADPRGPAGEAGQFDRHLDTAKQHTDSARDADNKAATGAHSGQQDTALQSGEPQQHSASVASMATARSSAMPTLTPTPTLTLTLTPTPIPTPTPTPIPIPIPIPTPTPTPIPIPIPIPIPTPTLESARTPAVASDSDSEVGDPAASALAGVMLALLGPAASLLARPTTAASAAQAGLSGVAGGSRRAGPDATAASLLQPDPAAATAPAATAIAPLVGDGVLSLATGVSTSASEAADDSLNAPAQAALSLAPATTAPATAHLLQLPSPVGSQAFAQELGQQIAWLGGQDVKQARIRLHPDELGQLDVKVSVTHGRVDVVFNAQHPAAVAVLQQSLQQLDQMLAQHGLSLGHAEVGQHQRGGQHGRGSDASNATAADEVSEVHGAAAPVSLGIVKLLDAFA